MTDISITPNYDLIRRDGKNWISVEKFYELVAITVGRAGGYIPPSAALSGVTPANEGTQQLSRWADRFGSTEGALDHQNAEETLCCARGPNAKLLIDALNRHVSAHLPRSTRYKAWLFKLALASRAGRRDVLDPRTLRE